MVWIYLLLLSMVQSIYTQTVSRFQNPWVTVVRRHSCSVSMIGRSRFNGRTWREHQNQDARSCFSFCTTDTIVECNIGETCDLSYENCRPSAFNSARPGSCPSPRYSMVPRFTVDCFDDAGCDAPQICCHSYYGSYCWLPNGRRTGRSLIPRITEARRNANRRRTRTG
uniref:WAP domain-containing protein n=1 Tax=Magallana gigas TaxID=29159 RepID=K1RMN3_MAGGI